MSDYRESHLHSDTRTHGKPDMVKLTYHLVREFNAEAVGQLEAMGFPLVRIQKALLATGNQDSQAAMEWLFQHMDDPGSCLLHLLD